MTEYNHCDKFRGCQKQFESIHEKLDRLDEAIRGPSSNGARPGILVRIDRLEQDAKRKSKIIWLTVGSLVTACGSAIMAWVISGGISP